MKNKLEIKYLKTDLLIPYVNNARTHSDAQVTQIAASIKEFGFNNPILLDGDKGIVAGHGRLISAKKLGLVEVPCIELSHLSEAQKKAYILADNKLAENAGWDDDLLKIELEELKELDFDLSLMGFDDDELNKLSTNSGNDGLTDPDDVPDVPEVPKTKLGDIYKLGNHRLMCGDSTDKECVEKLMDGKKADMVFTDPPYGMFLDTDYSKMPSVSATGNKKYDKIKGDGADFSSKLIDTVFDNFDYCEEMFMFGADYYSEYLPNKNDGSWIVWDKRVDENFDKMIGSGFELCWSRHKHKRMLARFNNTLFGGDSEAKGKCHPTQKPTKLVNWFFETINLQSLKTVVDLYGGSGTTLLSCEKNNKDCYMMELDPKYCDVIVKRWEDYTGKKAELIK